MIVIPVIAKILEKKKFYSVINGTLCIRFIRIAAFVASDWPHEFSGKPFTACGLVHFVPRTPTPPLKKLVFQHRFVALPPTLHLGVGGLRTLFFCICSLLKQFLCEKSNYFTSGSVVCYRQNGCATESICYTGNGKL